MKKIDPSAIMKYCKEYSGKGLATWLDHDLVDYYPPERLYGDPHAVEVTDMGVWKGKCMVCVVVEIIVGPDALADGFIRDAVWDYCGRNED